MTIVVVLAGPSWGQDFLPRSALSMLNEDPTWSLDWGDLAAQVPGGVAVVGSGLPKMATHLWTWRDMERAQTRIMTIYSEAKTNREMARRSLRMHLPRANNI
jgi:hypothetical protein